ncbi:MAG: OB-fold domain-containing protein [Betaproteobacteria bacterium]|nr:OB-fold domain-containing protein [Betaproteobacteria bacterium]
MEPSFKMLDERSGRYLPFIYPEEIPFWEAAKQRQIRLQRCSSCGRAWYPIGPACPFCFSMKFEWVAMSGRGTLHNYVVFHKAWTPWFEKRVPYAVVQVELEEGPRLTTNLLDCPIGDIRIGMQVEAAYEDVTDEITLVQFRPAKR